jgi:tRNA-binding EMAP/Myf-like protein
MSGVLLGRVVSSSPHPHADLIWIASVDVGEVEPRQIVYGGTLQLHPGDLVPVALPGSRLPSGMKLRRRRYRGIVSDGMLCSLAEMGGDPDRDRAVHVLAEGVKPGDPVDASAAPALWGAGRTDELVQSVAGRRRTYERPSPARARSQRRSRR